MERFRACVFSNYNRLCLLLAILTSLLLALISALLITLGIYYLHLIRLPFSLYVYPLETRIIPLNYISCKYISITLSHNNNNNGFLFSSNLSFLSEKPLLTYSTPAIEFTEVLEIASRSYRYYSIYMLADSSIDLSIETDLFVSIEFHITTSTPFNDNNTYEYSIDCVYKCDVTHTFTHNAEYYLVFYNPNESTAGLEFIIQLRKQLYLVDILTIYNHCNLNEEELDCTLQLPDSAVSFLYLMTGNMSYIDNWDSSQKISIQCPHSTDTKSISFIVVGCFIFIPICEFLLFISCLICKKRNGIKFSEKELIYDYRKHFDQNLVNHRYTYSYRTRRKLKKKNLRKFRLRRNSNIPIYSTRRPIIDYSVRNKALHPLTIHSSTTCSSTKLTNSTCYLLNSKEVATRMVSNIDLSDSDRLAISSIRCDKNPHTVLSDSPVCNTVPRKLVSPLSTNASYLILKSESSMKLSSSEEEINTSAAGSMLQIPNCILNSTKRVHKWRNTSASPRTSDDLEFTRKKNFSLRRLAMSKLYRKNKLSKHN